MIDISFNVSSKSGYSAQQLETLCKEGLQGLGQSFYDMEQKYNVNAVFAIAHAAIESTWGTSYIARRNNLFGIAAFDSNPNDAFDYPSKAICVDFYGDFLSFCYLDQPNPSVIRKLGAYEYSQGMYFSNGPTIDSIHDVFVRYSSSHDFEAQNIANLMNQLIATLPNPIMDNLFDFKVIVEDPSNNTFPTALEIQTDNEYNNATWNALKNSIELKKFHIERWVKNEKIETVELDVSQIIAGYEKQIADLKQQNLEMQQKADDLEKSLQQMTAQEQQEAAQVEQDKQEETSEQTQEIQQTNQLAKDEGMIKQLEAEITQLKEMQPTITNPAMSLFASIITKLHTLLTK